MRAFALLLALFIVVPAMGAKATARCATAKIASPAPDATDRFGALLRTLVEGKKIPVEIAGALADRNKPLNPFDLGNGSLREAEVLPFRRAFAELLAEGVDWKRVRAEAKLVAHGEGRIAEKRETVRHETKGILGLTTVAENINAGQVPFVENWTAEMRAAGGRDGSVYVQMGPYTIYKVRNGRTEKISLSLQSGRTDMLTSVDGGVYAVCFNHKSSDPSKDSLSIVDLETGHQVVDLRQASSEAAGYLRMRFKRGEPQTSIVTRNGRKHLALFWPQADMDPQVHYISLVDGHETSVDLPKTRTVYTPKPDGTGHYAHTIEQAADRSRKLVVTDFDSGKQILKTDASFLARDRDVWITHDKAGAPVVVYKTENEIVRHDLGRNTRTSMPKTTARFDTEDHFAPGPDGEPLFVSHFTALDRSENKVTVLPPDGSAMPRDYPIDRDAMHCGLSVKGGPNQSYLIKQDRNAFEGRISLIDLRDGKSTEYPVPTRGYVRRTVTMPDGQVMGITVRDDAVSVVRIFHPGKS